MDYLMFGTRTGLRVSELALGAGNLGTAWGSGADPAASRQILDRYAEAGGNFIDVADMYQGGQAELILADFLTENRDGFVLATKYTYGAESGRPVSLVGNSRKNMVASLEASLRRLRTDHVDILWVHNDDGVTPLEEIARGFDDLISSGKVLHAGLSNFPAWRTAHGVDLADRFGRAPIAAIQVEYSLAQRTADRELVPMAEAFGLGITTYSPLGGGLLTGKYRASDDGRLTSWRSVVLEEDSPQRTAILDAVLGAAAELDTSPTQVAMGWLIHHAAQSRVPWIPIIGPRTMEQLEVYLASLDSRLPDDLVARLDAVSATSLGVPHEIRLQHESTLAGGPDVRLRASSRPVR